MKHRTPESLPGDHPGNQEPVKRLSFNLPAGLHMRFKTACSANNRTMLTELQEFVARRAEELEHHAGLGEAWRQFSQGHRIGTEVRRLQALDRALACHHPTGDIDEMLADIERGRDLR